MNKQHQRLNAVEQRISELEDSLQTSNRDLHRAQKLIKSLEAKADVLENRGRRKHLVLTGLPEQVAHKNLGEFVQKEILIWLNMSTDQTLEIERGLFLEETDRRSTFFLTFSSCFFLFSLYETDHDRLQ